MKFILEIPWIVLLPFHDLDLQSVWVWHDNNQFSLSNLQYLILLFFWQHFNVNKKNELNRFLWGQFYCVCYRDMFWFHGFWKQIEGSGEFGGVGFNQHCHKISTVLHHIGFRSTSLLLFTLNIFNISTVFTLNELSSPLFFHQHGFQSTLFSLNTAYHLH